MPSPPHDPAIDAGFFSSSRLTFATCHRTSIFWLSPLRLRTAGERRRYQQVLASNGFVTAFRSLHTSDHQRAGSTPNDDEEAEEEAAQVRVEEMVSRHLRERNPDGLLRAFSEAATNLEYVQSIEPAVFTEILQVLNPKYFIDPYKDALDDLSSADLRDPTSTNLL